MRKTTVLRLTALLSAALAIAASGAAGAAAPSPGAPFPETVAGEVRWGGQAAIARDLVVPAGSSLLLERGSRLRFAPGAGLLLEGSLAAAGGSGAPVVLEPSGERWRGVSVGAEGKARLAGVTVLGAATGVKVNGGRLEVSDAAFEGNGRAIEVTLGGLLFLRGSRFTGNEVGVHLDLKAQAEIISCLFRGNQCGVGVFSGVTLRISGCSFEKGEMGIYASQESTLRVEGNVFSDDKVGMRLEQTGGGALVARNIFRGAGEAAVQAISYASPRILDNRFERGKTGIHALHFSSPEIVRNRISGMEEGVRLEKRNRSNITANVIEGNRTGVFCDFSTYPLLRDNAFAGNQVHIALGDMQSGAWEAAVGSAETVRRNAAEIDSRNVGLQSSLGPLPMAVDATGNWWDEATREEMDKKGEEGNISTLRDEHDIEPGRFEFPRDVITFLPYLAARPAAGPAGWKESGEGTGEDAQGTVAGRVVREDGAGAPGARVAAYAGGAPAGEPAAVSAPAGEDGAYSLRLSPGLYAFAASGGGLYSASGHNPVAVIGGEKLRLGFVLLPWEAPVSRKAAAPGEARIRGRVTLKGKGVEGVTLSLYLDAADFFRGPAFLSAPSGKDGSFALEMVQPGLYFLVARRRGSGQEVGPMARGDLFGYLRWNPLAVGEGEEILLTLPLIEKKLDRDVNALGVAGAQAGFSGTVRERGGKPLAGLHVFAYREPEMGHEKPAAVSSLTDGAGRYRLYLPAPGKYYVGAREGFGDSPAPGEWFGFWQGNPAHALSVGEGRTPGGIDIEVQKVLQ
jgi:nitrous oxidase accessory protein NosD